MPNRLAHETSPYLQQHADNPVNWYPWGEEALTAAREQDKPILLSVGYSACHWCHVMAHESFEDPEIATIMNRYFINIKVDREERPDLDQIYQLTHQMLSRRSGGWPLTMFLTADQKPFFGGTYFPKTPRYNLPGFGDLLQNIAEFYKHKRHEIEQQNSAVVDALNQTMPERGSASLELTSMPIETALRQLTETFDTRFGGFGDAPKFPHPMELEFCLRRYAASKDSATLNIATLTLERMALGGLYDQLGGGFHRYSVDAYWSIPHFEKMLYDNALLLKVYTDAWLITQNPLFKTVVAETADWVIREMQSPEGGYYSTLDADSEHEEGKFYVWTREQAKSLLDENEYALVAAYYGFNNAPNFENKYWHLNVYRSLEDAAKALNRSIDECARLLASARKKLFSARETRIKPGRDEKILTSWNGLMIQGMAHAARVFANQQWHDSARQAINFIQSTMYRQGRLLATYKDNRAHLNAYLDDYAFLINALIEMLQANFDSNDLQLAQRLADTLLDQFEDKEQGGFFFTSNDHEQLIHRPKPGFDNATPSGNGVAAFALQRLSFVTGERRYQQAAEHALRLFYNAIKEYPSGYTSLLIALEEFLTPTQTLILRGPATVLPEWITQLQQKYLPHTMVLAIPNNMTNLSAVLNKTAGAHVSAWLCQGTTCLAPITELAELVKAVQS